MGSVVLGLKQVIGLSKQANVDAIPDTADAREAAALDEVLRGELKTTEHKVPAMAVLLIICSSITLVNYLGHTELFTVLDTSKDLNVRIVMGISLLLLVAQAITVDYCIVKTFPRIGLYSRRFRREWPMFFEYLFYFIIGGGTEAYTYVGVIYSLDSNAKALFSSAPLIDPNSGQFKAQIGLRGVLFFWTIIQIILLDEDVRTDMVTLRETFAMRWGNFCMRIISQADPRRVTKGTAFRTFQAAVADVGDDEFLKKIDLLDSDEKAQQEKEGYDKAMVDFSAQRQELEARHQQELDELRSRADQRMAEWEGDHDLLRQQLSEYESAVGSVKQAIAAATRAIIAREEIPDEVVAVIPEMAFLAASISSRTPRPRTPGSTASREAERPAVDETLPAGAIAYRGTLYATAASAKGLIASGKWDTLSAWIGKSAKRTSIKDAKGGDVFAMRYLDFLDLLEEKSRPDARPKPVDLGEGIDLATLRTQAQGWRKGGADIAVPVGAANFASA